VLRERNALLITFLEVHDRVDVSECASSKAVLHFEAQESTAGVPTVGIELELKIDLQRVVDVEGALGLQYSLHGLLEGLCKLRNRYGPSRDTLPLR
jgi:hypothetical protein